MRSSPSDALDSRAFGDVIRIALAEVSREFTYDLWNETRKAVAATPSAQFFGQVEPGNNWAAFKLWYDAVAGKVEPVIYRKWLHRLAGVDVFTRENIVTVATSQMLDAPKDL
ncbi:hypothetical protein OG474_37750 [Kribbella sp. NBC_01505]|uniref:hypothetical protein n=1 Tax=Kribbella sp. NBC_01505 TaxID=2903580 RepID=UPI0038673AC0